jgi:hypothetical protein
LRSGGIHLTLLLTIVSCGPEKKMQVDTLDGLVPRDAEGESDAPVALEPEALRAPFVKGLLQRSLAVPVVPQFDRTTLAGIKHLVAAVREAEVLYSLSQGPLEARLDRTLAAIVEAGDKVPAELRSKIEPYARRVLAHRRTGLPMGCTPPGFIPGELAAAAQHALSAGKDLGLDGLDRELQGATRLEKLERLLSSIRPTVFSCGQSSLEDSDSERSMAEPQSPPISKAWRRLADLLESSVVGVGPMVGQYLSTVARAIREGQSASDSGLAWVPSSGPVEVFVDWREGSAADLCVLVALRDGPRTALAQKVTSSAAELEMGMPWPLRLKRRGNEVRASQVVVADLIAGFCPRLGASGGIVSWPASFAPRDTSGKLLYLNNVARALREEMGEDRLCAARSLAILGMGLGAALGKESHLVRGDPATMLAEQYPFVEHLRRTLIALFLSFDPAVVKYGLFDAPRCASLLVDEALVGPRRIACRLDRPQDEALAQALVVGRLAASLALPDKDQDGERELRIIDPAKAKPVLAELLAEVQRIASSGDKLGAGRLRDEATRSRLSRASLPTTPCVLLLPQVDLQTDPSGALVGLALSQTTDILLPGMHAPPASLVR